MYKTVMRNPNRAGLFGYRLGSGSSVQEETECEGAHLQHQVPDADNICTTNNRALGFRVYRIFKTGTTPHCIRHEDTTVQ